MPGRFGLIPEGTAQSEEVKHEAGLGSTLRLRLLGIGPRLYPLVGGLVKVSVYALGFYAEETQAVEKLRGALVVFARVDICVCGFRAAFQPLKPTKLLHLQRSSPASPPHWPRTRAATIRHLRTMRRY